MMVCSSYMGECEMIQRTYLQESSGRSAGDMGEAIRGPDGIHTDTFRRTLHAQDIRASLLGMGIPHAVATPEAMARQLAQWIPVSD